MDITDIMVMGVLFWVYSFFGWLVESLYISFLNKKWTNRGFARLPFCAIYGFGELIGYRLLLLLGDHYIAIFLIGTTFATLLEFCTAKWMMHKFGAVWWDYSKRPFNYKGILCLESTVAWGVYAVCEMAFVHDGFESIIRMLPFPALCVIGPAMGVIYTTDFILACRKVKREGIKSEENNVLKI